MRRRQTIKSGPAICSAHEDHVIFEALGRSWASPELFVEAEAVLGLLLSACEKNQSAPTPGRYFQVCAA